MHERLLLTVINRHSAAAPEFDETSDQYVGYFSNVHGEQLVFTCRHGEGHATLYHGDNDWTASRVTEAPPGAVDQKLREAAGDADIAPDHARELAQRVGISLYPFVSDVILDAEERQWLAACWEASRPFREAP